MRKKDTNKEQQIKDKALEMIVENGFDSFGMQKLARAVGVSPATIYIYFNDKEDLILKLYKDVMDSMVTETLNNFSPEISFKEGLRRQWKNRANFYLHNKSKAVFLEQIRHSSLNEKCIGLTDQRFTTAMHTFVNTAIENKELVEIPVEVFWSIAYAPLYNLMRFHEAGHSFMNQKFELTDEVLDQTLNIVLKGLKP